MQKIKQLLLNSYCTLTIECNLHPIPFFILHSLAMLQTLAALADTNSQIYLLVKWFDPAIYLPNDAVVYLVFCIIVVFAVALIGMLATCDSDCLLKTPSTAKLYFSYALCYLLLLTETFLMAPLLRSSVQCFKDKILLGLGMVNLSIYLFVMLPLALFCSNNDFSLSSSLHNRVYRLNMYFLFTVVRSKMILFSALKPSLSPIFIVIFFILYVVVSLKRPFVSYRYDWALRGILAIIGFMCLSRIYELLVGLQSALLYITGMILFVVFADTLSKMRVKHILNNPNMTTLKIKTLLYLIYDLQTNCGLLALFLLEHHRVCKHIGCKCRILVDELCEKGIGQQGLDFGYEGNNTTTNKQSKTSSQGFKPATDPDKLTTIASKTYNSSLWYQFVRNQISLHYNSNQIVKLPTSKMCTQLYKLSELALSKCQIQLFQLKKCQTSYYNLVHFSNLLEDKEISNRHFAAKKHIMMYYMEQQLQARHVAEGVANKYAEQFLDFQLTFEKYRKILLKSADKAVQLWTQLDSKQPDSQKIEKGLRAFHKYQVAIRQAYSHMCRRYMNPSDVIDDTTLHYCLLVLEISEHSPYGITKKEKSKKIIVSNEEQDKFNKTKISENMQCFSYNSKTPMCIISVNEDTFGKVRATNLYFNLLIGIQDSKALNISDFMIPQLVDVHTIKARALVETGIVSLTHRKGYIIKADGHLIHCKVMIQTIPSLDQGLCYAFFVKKQITGHIYIVLRNLQILHTSPQYDYLKQTMLDSENYITKQLLQSLHKGQKVTLEFSHTQYELQLKHHVVVDTLMSISFIEFHNVQEGIVEDNQIGFDEALRFTVKDIIKRNSPDSEQTSNANQEKLSPKQQKFKQQQFRQHKQLNDLIAIIDNDNDCRNILRWNIFTTAIVVVLVVLGGCSIALSNSFSNQSITATKIYSSYHQLLTKIIKSVKYQQLLNYYADRNNQAALLVSFTLFNKYSDINSPMNQLLSLVQLQDVTWKTFLLNDITGEITVTSKNSFLTIIESVQNPVTNLVNNPTNSLNMSIYRPLVPLPYSLAIGNFYQVRFNSLYSSIFNLRDLKTKQINTATANSLNFSPLIYSILSIGIVSLFAYVLGTYWVGHKIALIKQQFYGILETSSSETISKKKKACQEFCLFFREFTIRKRVKNEPPKKKITEFQDLNNDESSLRIDKINPTDTNRQLSESNINVNLSNSINKKLNSHKRNKGRIFPPISKKQLLCHSIYTLPFLAILLALLVLSIQNNNKVIQYLTLQQTILQSSENVNLVQIYAAELSVYEQQLQNYINIPSYMNSLINATYELQRQYVAAAQAKMADFGDLDTAFTAFMNTNVCDALAVYGVTNLTDTPFSLDTCKTVSDSLLTKGYYFALTGYLESASALLAANPNTTNYNYNNRLAIWTSQFLADKTNLIPYFQTVNQFLFSMFRTDMQNTVQQMQKTIIILSAMFIVLALLIFGVVMLRTRRKFLSQLALIKSASSLISYETMTKDQSISRQLSLNYELFTFLK